MRGTRTSLLFGLLVALGCGSTEIKVDVDLASNQSGNPLLDIQSQIDAGQSRGVFFRFDPLKCPPSSNDDVNAALPSFQQPPEGEPTGASPVQRTYKIDTTSLQPNTFYRITMFAANLAGTTTHRGISDCPINVDMGGQNQSTICFGFNDPAAVGPICPNSISFVLCPGVSQGLCTP